MERRAREVSETRRADAAQRESDHHRWADDGGFSPEPEAALPEAVIPIGSRSPWAAVRIAALIGFTLGWVGRRWGT